MVLNFDFNIKLPRRKALFFLNGPVQLNRLRGVGNCIPNAFIQCRIRLSTKSHRLSINDKYEGKKQVVQ
jgi:hypothetical protein